MNGDDRRGEAVPIAVGIVIGAIAWVATMASAPRYSYGAEHDMGNAAYYPLVVAAAGIGGWLVPRRASLVGMALGTPGLVMSPWTAPRGDNDGLWVLIIPILAVFVVMLACTARLSGWVRGRLVARRSPT